MPSYTEQILEALAHKEQVCSTELSIPGSEIHGILLSLVSKEQVVFEIKETQEYSLTDEGAAIAKDGSQEYRLYQSVGEEGADSSVLQQFQHGSKHAFKNRWIKLENDRIFRAKSDVVDETAIALSKLAALSIKEVTELKKRNLVCAKKINTYVIRRGEKYGVNDTFETELTEEMVQNFQNQEFKKYNFNSLGNIPHCGSLHPLMKIREEFKRIFIEMGFSEMKTNKYVESSFWNFDSLFQPQNHPSRDSHDTFFLKNPELTGEFDTEYLKKVKEVHEKGGYGSLGHSCSWSTEEASKNLLRTHTTAVSARYLKQLAGDFKPCKFFSIDKVFRNESIDATHLAEFHQVEGLIAGYNLGISDLMGIMSTFFKKLGLKNIKYKPAFNPYTEPSMEIFGFHEGLGKWIEIGNSGIFRPEMLRPMGYDEDVCVIAWGLSLERPAMIKYGLSNIRELVGHKVDINFIKKGEFIYF
ncbi:phenylalanyl-tRNA synthetase alpha chain [Enteropsectra breve]|nr:phenylalanyl-tRNA synthetase alpha chain [Enteropsectra breve]